MSTDMSKYLKQAEKVSIPRHRHCIVCSTPIAMEREFCSTSCEDEFKRMEKKRKYQMFIPLLLLPIVFVVLLLISHR
jgi:predicted nucleic acid-binding Zn ribbon protein